MAMTSKEWIGVDFDCTLATWTGWGHHLNLGKPIGPMVRRVKKWLEQGKTVKIMTARANIACYLDPQDIDDPVAIDKAATMLKETCIALRAWCVQNIGRDLEITYCKDHHMVELWDDRARQVEPNTGRTTLMWDPLTPGAD